MSTFNAGTMKLGFGAMRLPTFDGDDKRPNPEAVAAMADAFLAQGFTYFDTAYGYHGGGFSAIIVIIFLTISNFRIDEDSPLVFKTL